MRQSPETDAARRRVRQSIREYELILLLRQRLRAVSWPHWRLRCMRSHCMATAWELSDLDHSHAATPQRVTRASCAQLLRSDLAPPAVDLLEALGRCVCTRRACCLFAHVALLLLPLSLFLGVRAPSRFPSVALGSKLLDVAHCSLLHQLFLLCFGFIHHWH